MSALLYDKFLTLVMVRISFCRMLDSEWILGCISFVSSG